MAQLKREREWIAQADFYQQDHLWAKITPDQLHAIKPLNRICTIAHLKEIGLLLALEQRDYQATSLSSEAVSSTSH